MYIGTSILDFMSYKDATIYDAEQKRTILAQKIKNGDLKVQVEDKTHKTLSFSVSEWALIEQIRSKYGLKDLTEGMLYAVWNTAIQEGIETG